MSNLYFPEKDKSSGIYVFGMLGGMGQGTRLFCRILADALAIIPAVDYCKILGKSEAFISNVKAGRKKPPLKSVEKWADALKLSGEKRDEFLTAARLANSPPEIERDYLIMQEALAGIGRQSTLSAAEPAADYTPEPAEDEDVAQARRQIAILRDATVRHRPATRGTAHQARPPSETLDITGAR
jgi:hypothetical protein